MGIARVGTIALVAAAATALAGCQLLGPAAISHGRDRYNDSIQETSKEQTLANMVRIHRNEPTLFVDITEVDASQSLGGSLGGGTTNIGAKRGTSGGTLAGETESAQGAIQYSETPTVRYQPLLGNSLVSQLVTPISVDVIADLFDAWWNVPPLIDFSAAYVTVDDYRYPQALNAFTELNDNNALQLLAGRSQLTQSASPPETTAANIRKGDLRLNIACDWCSTLTKSDKKANDTLSVYFLPFTEGMASSAQERKKRDLQLWIRLLRIYDGTQPPFAPEAGTKCERFGLQSDGKRVRTAGLTDWDLHIDARAKGADLNEVRRCLPDVIELRTVPLSQDIVRKNGLTTGAAVMRTNSALGILRTAILPPEPKIEFVTPDAYNTIRSHPWNQNTESKSYYTLLPTDEDSVDCPSIRQRQRPCDNPPEAEIVFDSKNISGDKLDHWIACGPDRAPAENCPENGNYHDGLVSYEGSDANQQIDTLLDPEAEDLGFRLHTLRRYILIVVADKLPAEAVYASYADRDGRWYYIEGDDDISQQNFHLLTLFLTMMAVPSATPPLSPVINVGG